MKKKSIWIFTSVLLVTALVAGSVYAFYKGNIDGVWGEIDQLQYLDIIGQIGYDPGTEWGTGNLSTADNTMVRNPDECLGDIDGSDPFDPAGHGIGYLDGTVSGLGSHTYTCNGNGLIISEYVETSTGIQAIEIFNATNYPIALLGVKLQIFYDGSPTAGTTIDLTTNAILAANDVYVIADQNITGVIADQISSYLDFDGNDVVALVRGGAPYVPAIVYVDIIGQIGVDPGTEWGTGLTSTADNTIRRKSTICTGDTNGGDAFVPSVEWDGYADQTYDGLGLHTASCTGTDLIISEYVESTSHSCGWWCSRQRRVIEIYNASNLSISLLGYKIQIFSNGSSTATTTIDLTNTTLAAGALWVVSDYNYSDIAENQVNSDLDFNGDDAVALVKVVGPESLGYGDAECSNWATGPTGTDPDAAPTTWQDTYWNQSGSTTDWNQVRYGRPGKTGYNTCADVNDTADFLLQSGFGFNGVDLEDPLVYYGENQPFVMGVLCHYNNPIWSQSNDGKLQSVPLTVTVDGIKCDDGNDPIEGSSTSFTYNLRLDETTNTDIPLDDCPYPSTISCSDGVFISQPPPGQVFTCNYGTSTVTYTIVTLGFMQEDSEGNCPAWNAALAKRDFISDEGQTNCACMYGMIADEVPQAVELLYFSAEAIEGAISLEWATASETDNFGFNLYRATALDGEQTQLNEGLIPSLVAPGSPYGAEYSFVDETAEPGVLYYYWLEDVELSMITTLHGPVEAIIE